MFDSAYAVLNHYLSDVTRYNFYSVEMRRGENPEDIYYLCHIHDAWFVVYETDYIGELHVVMSDILAAFGDYELKPQRWLAKKDAEDAAIAETSDQTSKEKFVFKSQLSYLRCAVLAVEVNVKEGRRFHPAVYGSSE